VFANGTAARLDATTNAAVFNAMRVGYGAIAVAVWIELRVVPIWRMEMVTAPLDLTKLLSILPTLAAQYDRYQWYYYPYDNSSARLVVRANTTAPISGCWGGGRSRTPVTPPPVALGAWPAGTTACVDVSYKTMTGSADDATLYTEVCHFL
jgi:hypothetical protein